MVIKPNKDNDLKFRRGLIEEDDNNKKKSFEDNKPITEQGNETTELEYFTE